MVHVTSVSAPAPWTAFLLLGPVRMRLQRFANFVFPSYVHLAPIKSKTFPKNRSFVSLLRSLDRQDRQRPPC
jgi:hypothetical protein